MLPKKQLEEIKERLNAAANPIFLFDNDQDGLCSFLLLQRYIGRGKGVVVKSFPNLDVGFFRRVIELEADAVFILDKPNVSAEFFEEVKKVNLPVTWIDHHQSASEIPSWVGYYNSLLSGTKKGEPVTDICYHVVEKKEDLWLAVAGCVADSFMPKYYSNFLKQFPNLGIKTSKPFQVLYSTEIGKLARLMGAGIMDTTTNMVSMFKILMKAKSPYDLLEKNTKNSFIHNRFEFLEERRKKLVHKALNEGEVTDKYIYFEYRGDTSMSADISNELCYLHPEKYIIVVYLNGVKANISTRGNNVKTLVMESMEGINSARGGGHIMAAGGQVNVEELPLFKEKILAAINLL